MHITVHAIQPGILSVLRFALPACDRYGHRYVLDARMNGYDSWTRALAATMHACVVAVLSALPVR
jgi:hypothetical protein